MPVEFDPRLLGLLQSALGLGDSLNDVGTMDDVTVQLSREDGLKVLKLVAGANDADAEAFSQQGRTSRHGVNSLSLAGVTFEWPRADAARRRPQASRLFSTAPGHVGMAVNDNDIPTKRYYGFEDDAPARR
jgi:hypothetical protein